MTCEDCDKKCNSHEDQLIKLEGVRSKMSALGWILSLLLMALLLFVTYTFIEFNTFRTKIMDINTVVQSRLATLTSEASSLDRRLEIIED